MLPWFWLIPFLPFAGALLNGVVGHRLSRRTVGVIACVAVLLAFLLSAGAAIGLTGDWQALEAAAPDGMRVDAERKQIQLTLWTWIPAGPDGTLSVDWGFLLDPLSAVMILVVTGVGSLIHIYSVGYMDVTSSSAAPSRDATRVSAWSARSMPVPNTGEPATEVQNPIRAS